MGTASPPAIPPVPDLGAYLNRLRAYLMVLVLATPTAWYARWMVLLERWTGAKGQLAGLGRWRVHRRLAPLWRALRPVRPSLSLLPAPRRIDLWWPGDLDFRVCSEAMEIRDWSIRLRPYVPPETPGIAATVAAEAGLPAADLQAFSDAAQLAAGLRAWYRGVKSADQVLAARETNAVPTDNLGDEELALARVADFFTHSPLIPVILARIDGNPAPI